jgi:hypothetical protein
MPLKLLKHKSWHVGTKENIERVKRDEAAERARIEEDEQRMQDEDARNKLAILRGQAPPVPAIHERSEISSASRSSSGPRREKRSRKRDDTEALDAHLQGKQIPIDDMHRTNAEDLGRVLEGKSDSAKKSASTDFHFAQPWYVSKSAMPRDDDNESKEKKKARLDMARKHSADPLVAMQAFLAQKKALDQQRQPEEQPVVPTVASAHNRDRSHKHERRHRESHHPDKLRHEHRHRKTGRSRSKSPLRHS